MRKFWVGLALTSLIVASAAAGAWAASGTRKNIEVEYNSIKIAVDGKTVDVGDVEPFIYVEKGRTFVPARPLAEALGAKVGWNAESSTVEVYTPSFVKVTTDGEYKLWSMPGQGFSIRAPRGFMRQDLPTSLLQLALPDPATGTNSVIAITRSEIPADGSTQQQRMDALVSGLAQTFLPDLKVTASATDGSKLTVDGTCTLFGKVPANVTFRMLSTGKTDWFIMALTPSAVQSQMAPVMLDALNSFTVTP